jgi:hypothetical protein
MMHQLVSHTRSQRFCSLHNIIIVESFADASQVRRHLSASAERFDLMFINVALTDGSGVQVVADIEASWRQQHAAVVCKPKFHRARLARRSPHLSLTSPRNLLPSIFTFNSLDSIISRYFHCHCITLYVVERYFIVQALRLCSSAHKSFRSKRCIHIDKMIDNISSTKFIL